MSIFYCENCHQFHDADYIDTVLVGNRLVCEVSAYTATEPEQHGDGWRYEIIAPHGEDIYCYSRRPLKEVKQAIQATLDRLNSSGEFKPRLYRPARAWESQAGAQFMEGV